MADVVAQLQYRQHHPLPRHLQGRLNGLLPGEGCITFFRGEETEMNEPEHPISEQVCPRPKKPDAVMSEIQKDIKKEEPIRTQIPQAEPMECDPEVKQQFAKAFKRRTFEEFSQNSERKVPLAHPEKEKFVVEEALVHAPNRELEDDTFTESNYGKTYKKLVTHMPSLARFDASIADRYLENMRKEKENQKEQDPQDKKRVRSIARPCTAADGDMFDAVTGSCSMRE